MKQFAVAILAALGCAGLASASLIPVLDGGSPTLVSPGVYKWTYTAGLAQDEELNAAQTSINGGCGGAATASAACGTYFTIYDIPGFLTSPAPGVPATPAGWTAQYQLSGLTPSMTLPPDSGSLMNVSYVYTGSAVITGPQNFDGFTFDSSFGTVSTHGFYSYQATKIQDVSANDQGLGPVSIPAGVPEPASMALIGGGLVGLAMLRRKFAR